MMNKIIIFVAMLILISAILLMAFPSDIQILEPGPERTVDDIWEEEFEESPFQEYQPDPEYVLIP